MVHGGLLFTGICWKDQPLLLSFVISPITSSIFQFYLNPGLLIDQKEIGTIPHQSHPLITNGSSQAPLT